MVTNDTSGEIDPRKYDRTTAELDLQSPTFRIVSRDILPRMLSNMKTSLGH